MNTIHDTSGLLAYDDLINGELAAYAEASAKVGGPCEEQAQLFCDAFRQLRDLLEIASGSKKPDGWPGAMPDNVMEIIQGVGGAIGAIGEIDGFKAGQLEYIPHGADETFYYDTHDVVSNAGGILAYTCRQSSACRARFKEHVEEVLDIADEIDLLGYHISVAEQIEPLVEDDRNKDYSNDYVWYYQADMEDFIDQRRSTLTSMLDL